MKARVVTNDGNLCHLQLPQIYCLYTSKILSLAPPPNWRSKTIWSSHSMNSFPCKSSTWLRTLASENTRTSREPSHHFVPSGLMQVQAQKSTQKIETVQNPRLLSEWCSLLWQPVVPTTTCREHSAWWFYEWPAPDAQVPRWEEEEIVEEVGCDTDTPVLPEKLRGETE